MGYFPLPQLRNAGIWLVPRGILAMIGREEAASWIVTKTSLVYGMRCADWLLGVSPCWLAKKARRHQKSQYGGQWTVVMRIFLCFSLKTCLEDEMESYHYLLDGRLDMTMTERYISSTTTARKPHGLTQETGRPTWVLCCLSWICVFTAYFQCFRSVQWSLWVKDGWKHHEIYGRNEWWPKISLA